MANLFWERRQGETSRSYQAFCVYRDQGITRSLRKAAEEFYQGATRAKVVQFETWSSQNLWVARAEAFDAELDRRRSLEREEHIREALERGRRAALLLQRIALDGLTTYQMQGGGDPPLVLLKYLQAGLEEERLALGIPTDITQLDHQGIPDHSAASEPDKRQQAYLKARQALS
jgi:hypothetical protein